MQSKLPLTQLSSRKREARQCERAETETPADEAGVSIL